MRKNYTMQCKNCSGQDFVKLSDGEYKCKYCGSKKILNVSTANNIKTNLQQIKHLKLFLIIFFAVFFALGLFFSLYNTKTSNDRIFTRDTNNISSNPEDLTTFDNKSIKEEIPPAGDFRNISIIPDSIGNIYVVGLYKNIGKSPMRKPEVSVILLSKAGRKVASSHGYGLRDFLLPTEKTPVSILFRNVPQYSDYKIKHEPQKPYSFTKLTRPKIIFKNTNLEKGKYSGYEVTGELYNKDNRSIKYANIGALLYDKKKSIIGYGTGYLKEKNLVPGDYSPFRINVTSVIGKPDSFMLDYNGVLKK